MNLSLLRKTKGECFANLNTKIVKNNRKSWKTVNLLFSAKSYSKEYISLINKYKIAQNEDLAKTLIF